MSVAAPPQKQTRSPWLGCFLGCAGIIALILLLVLGTAFYQLKFGALSAARRVDTVAQLDPNPALLLRVNLKAATAPDLAMIEGSTATGAAPGGLLRMLLPYEGSLMLSVPPDGSEVYLGGALSTPRGANLLRSMLEDQRAGVAARGGKVTVLETRGDDQGVLALRAVLPLPKEAPTVRGEAWTSPLEGPAPPLEANHFIEATLDNRNGEAALAFTALAAFLQMESPETEDTIGPADSPADKLSLLSQVRLIKGSRFLKTATMSVDFIAPDGDVDLHFSIDGKDEFSAAFMMTALGDLPETLNAKWKPEGVDVDGTVNRDGARIDGALKFHGVARQIGQFMEDYSRRSASGAPAWLDSFGAPPTP